MLDFLKICNSRNFLRSLKKWRTNRNFSIFQLSKLFHRNKRKVTSSHSNDRPFKNKRVNKVVRQNMKLMNPDVGRRRNLSVQNQKYDSSSLLDGARKKVPTVINPSSASKQANQRGNCRYPSSGRNVHYGMGSKNLFS